MENFYDILGISQNASGEEIKKAYRRLSKKYHPDANPGDKEAAEHFARVAEAYAVLQDPEKRRKYDLSLQKKSQNPFRENSGKRAAASGKGGIDFGDLESRFSQFFGFRAEQGNMDKDGSCMNGNKNKNPIDMTDVFEKYMGIRK